MNEHEEAEFARHVREQVTGPMAESFAVTTIWSGEPDWKICLETGAAVLLDKPIILLVVPGVKVPDKLAQIADDIIEMPAEGPTTESARRIAEAMRRLGMGE
jgi:hypothetical protein